MNAVLDTSAAAAIVLQRRGSDPLVTAVQDADLVLVPQLFVAEIVNTFWKYHHLHDMPLPDCQAALEDAIALPDEIVAHEALYREVFGMACQSSSPAYDMFFLVLARRNDALLVTADVKLTERARKYGVRTL